MQGIFEVYPTREWGDSLGWKDRCRSVVLVVHAETRARVMELTRPANVDNFDWLHDLYTEGEIAGLINEGAKHGFSVNWLCLDWNRSKQTNMYRADMFGSAEWVK